MKAPHRGLLSRQPTSWFQALVYRTHDGAPTVIERAYELYPLFATDRGGKRLERCVRIWWLRLGRSAAEDSQEAFHVALRTLGAWLEADYHWLLSPAERPARPALQFTADEHLAPSERHLTGAPAKEGGAT